jgi:hypothetical protein
MFPKAIPTDPNAMMGQGKQTYDTSKKSVPGADKVDMPSFPGGAEQASKKESSQT